MISERTSCPTPKLFGLNIYPFLISSLQNIFIHIFIFIRSSKNQRKSYFRQWFQNNNFGSARIEKMGIEKMRNRKEKESQKMISFIGFYTLQIDSYWVDVILTASHFHRRVFDVSFSNSLCFLSASSIK